MIISDELLAGVLGIIGTILGTILGWLLNSLSQKGKLIVYVNNCSEEFSKLEIGCCVTCDSSEAEYYSCDLTADLYNSSRDTKIMRDIKLLFLDGKKLLFEAIPKDEYTRRKSQGGIPLIDEVSVLNIKSKSVEDIKLHYGMNDSDDNWNSLKDVSVILLSYYDEKNKRRKCNVLMRDKIVIRTKN